MENNSYFKEWLAETRYLYLDVFDDNFAINFEKKTHQELIELGLLKPLTQEELSSQFKDLPF